MGHQCSRPPLPILECIGPGRPLPYPSSSSTSPADSSRGFSVWVDSVDDLVTALSLEAETSKSELEHLFALREGGGDAACGGTDRGQLSDRMCGARSPVEDIYFLRDVGVRSGRPSSSKDHAPFSWSEGRDLRPCTDSYACVQVDDIGNPWGFCGIAEGYPAKSSNMQKWWKLGDVPPRLAADLPAMLVRHPRVHSDPCRALYDSHKAATKVASLGTVYPEENAALTMVFLKDEFLHIAWSGDAKIVLGRLASKPPAPSKPVPDAVTHQGKLRLASRHRPAVARKEGYVNSQQMKQFLQFDGPPPILRAVDLTADSAGSGVTAGDSAGGGYFGQSPVKGLPESNPEVRRMKLKAEDVCVIVATSSLWKWLSPEEVVTIVGQKLNCMASDAADALVAEVYRRMQPMPGSEDTESANDEVTVSVIYLAGERYVKDFDIEAAKSHLQQQGDFFASEGLVPALNEPAGLQWGCCRGSGSSKLPGGPD